MMQRHFTQREMAAALGVSETTIGRWVRRLKDLRQVQKALEPGSQDDVRFDRRRRKGATGVGGGGFGTSSNKSSSKSGYNPPPPPPGGSGGEIRHRRPRPELGPAEQARRDAVAERVGEWGHTDPQGLIDRYGLEHAETALRELERGWRDLSNPAGWLVYRCRALAEGAEPLFDPFWEPGSGLAEVSPETSGPEEWHVAEVVSDIPDQGQAAESRVHAC